MWSDLTQRYRYCIYLLQRYTQNMKKLRGRGKHLHIPHLHFSTYLQNVVFTLIPYVIPGKLFVVKSLSKPKLLQKELQKVANDKSVHPVYFCSYLYQIPS